MRPHLLSLCVGLAVGWIGSGFVEAPHAAPKKKATESCWDRASSQLELNACAGESTLAAEQKILQQQTVRTAQGEELTLASLATVRREIERLQRLIASEAQGGRRSMIRRNYLE